MHQKLKCVGGGRGEEGKGREERRKKGRGGEEILAYSVPKKVGEVRGREGGEVIRGRDGRKVRGREDREVRGRQGREGREDREGKGRDSREVRGREREGRKEEGG